MTQASWPGELPRFEIPRGDERYPASLELTPDPPACIRGFGDPEALVPSLGMIGARKATPYGLTAARVFGTWAAEAGYTVVSGGAIGCDQASHCAALDAGGRTVVVLGSGADVAYPRGVDQLLFSAAKNGAVISELPWGSRPAKWTFRARNRIIAGLSAALLVLEAGLGSGTFITADAMLDAGRPVLVVPGSIYAPECAGTNRLLRQGATPVTDVSELRAELEDLLGGADADALGDCLIRGSDPVLAMLRTNPARPDDVARALGLDIITVARRVGDLESRGLLSRYRDGRYGPC